MIAKRINKYLSFVKIAHVVFALPFALIGYFLAIKYSAYNFEPVDLLLIVLCMLFARNSAMGFNRLIDRKFDKQNPRTSEREIPSGKISPKAALIFVVANALLFILCTYFLNPLVFYLSFVALGVILGYSLTKRYTFLCHLILGLGLALSPVGAYLAIAEEFNVLPVLFSIIVLFWTSGFDIMYALQDIEFDKTIDLKSVPAYFGIKKSLIISSLAHLVSAIFVVIAGIVGNFEHFYWFGSSVFIALLIYQHLIVKENQLKKINLAFFTLNGLASLIFSTFVILDLIIK